MANLARAWETWESTVRCETCNRTAISRFVKPSHTRRTTESSDRLSRMAGDDGKVDDGKVDGGVRAADPLTAAGLRCQSDTDPSASLSTSVIVPLGTMYVVEAKVSKVGMPPWVATEFMSQLCRNPGQRTSTRWLISRQGFPPNVAGHPSIAGVVETELPVRFDCVR